MNNTDNETQKTNAGKRIMAFVIDVFLTILLAMALSFLLSMALGAKGRTQELNDKIGVYEAEYGVKLIVTEEEYDALTPEQKKAYEEAYIAASSDAELEKMYRSLVRLMLVTVCGSLLASVLILECLFPLRLGQGRSTGKLLTGLAITDRNGGRARLAALFLRALGKYVLVFLLPGYLYTMLRYWTVSSVSLALLPVLLIAQLLLFFKTPRHTPLHDLLAGTVVTDYTPDL
nr:RDD family protein [Lachnospiraceae bacterium]